MSKFSVKVFSIECMLQHAAAAAVRLNVKVTYLEKICINNLGTNLGYT